jgi:hypothetical protein
VVEKSKRFLGYSLRWRGRDISWLNRRQWGCSLVKRKWNVGGWFQRLDSLLGCLISRPKQCMKVLLLQLQRQLYDLASKSFPSNRAASILLSIAVLVVAMIGLAVYQLVAFAVGAKWILLFIAQVGCELGNGLL